MATLETKETTITTMAAEIEELKSDATTAATELARITAERDAVLHELDLVKNDRDTLEANPREHEAVVADKNIEINYLSSSYVDTTRECESLAASINVKDALIANKTQEISAKDALIAELQQRPPPPPSVARGGAGVEEELRKLQTAYDGLYDDYLAEQNAKEESWAQNKELLTPGAVNGSFNTVLAVVNAAAAVTCKKKRGEWNSAECEERVTEMVKGMLSKTEAAKVTVVKDMTTKVCFLFLLFCVCWTIQLTQSVPFADNAPSQAFVRGVRGAAQHART